jgi:polysaccharide chain length determinant protein (PEP-CTERM system associated)
MDDTIKKLVNELRSAWRFRWQALGVAWLVCIVGWAITFMLPDQFEAEARFFVDTSTRLDEVISGITVKSDDASQIALVRQAMLSTPALEAVARDTDLDLLAPTPNEKQKLVAYLADKITVTSTSSQGRRGRDQDEGIFEIAFRYPDRQKALAVVDTMLDNFREDVVSGRAEGTEETVDFLKSEIAEYGARLEAREQAIAQFKADNVGLLPGEAGGYFDILQKSLVNLRTLEAEYSVLMDRRSALLNQMRGEKPMIDNSSGSGSGVTGVQNDLDQRINDLEGSIEEMLTKYTEKWPDVIAAKDQLEQLYKRRDEELAELENSAEDGKAVPSNNPVYQQLQISLNETDVEVAEVEQRLMSLRSDIASLEGRIDVVPEVETELASLTRDLQQLQAVYSSLRQRLQQEQLRKKRLGWGGVTFRILDPPKVSIEPVAPMRLQLIILVLVAGLGAGGAVAFLLHLVKPVFINPESLREITGLPVLGAVSLAWKADHLQQRRRELNVLIAATAGMIAVAILAVVFADIGIELGADIRRLFSL